MQNSAPVVRKQGAWSVWWLCVITFGVYYYVWYHRINQELSAVTGTPVPSDGQWWSQLIPFYNLYGLAKTASRLNAAHAAVGSPTRVSAFVTWFWAPLWYSSQTRYLQRRVNTLHDVLASHSALGQPTQAPAFSPQLPVAHALVPAEPSIPAQPAAGWYPGPDGQGERFWDGAQWTPQVR